MFYRHWKKLALALTAFFWASCGEDTPSPSGVSPDPESSSSGDTSSSSQEASSSSTEESSSSYIPLSAPLYGVFQMDCNIVDMQNPTPGCTDGSSSSTATSSSSAEESSSSSGVTCSLDLNSMFYKNRSERYTESQAKSNATTQAKRDASDKISEIIRDSLKSKDVPKCLEDIQVSLEDSFAALYGTFGTHLPKQFKCSDGSTILTDEYLEQQAFDEEQAKKKPQYDEKYNEFYKEESEKLDKKINDCLNSESQGN